MDILIFLLGLGITIVGAVLCLGNFMVPHPYPRFRDHPKMPLMVGTLLAGFAILWWFGAAINAEAKSEPSTRAFIAIESRGGSNHFFAPDGTPKSINNEWKYADPSKWQIEFRVHKPGWHYGIYTSGTVEWKIVPKDHPKVETH